MEKILRAVALSVVIILLSSCAKGNSEVDDIITSNNSTHEVTVEEFNTNLEQFKESYKQRYIANLKASNPNADAEKQWETILADDKFMENFKNLVLESVIMDKVFYDEAVKTKLVPSEKEINKSFEEIKARYESEEKFNEDLKQNNLTVDEVKENIKKQMATQNFVNSKNEKISKLKPTDDDLEKIYNNNLSQYNTVRASHILVDTKKQAKDIKDRLKKGESFEDLAKEFSKCPSKEKGGDLGFFNVSQNVKEFSIVAFNLKVDEISEPVETEFGWHIIKVTDKIDSFDKVNKDDLKSVYLENMQQKMYENYLLNAKVKLPSELQTRWDNLINVIKTQNKELSKTNK